MKLDELVSAAKSLDSQPPPPEAEARMWAKIAVRAGAVVGLGAAGLGAKTASASTAAASTAAASTSSLALTVAKVGTALALAGGIGAGVATVASDPDEPAVDPVAVVDDAPAAAPERSRSKAVVPRAKPTSEPEPEPEVLLDDEEVAPEPEPTAEAPKPRRRAKPRVAPPAAETSALADESALLGRARVASARGNHRDALAALARHAKRFPSGELAEVRRALEVRVLCDLGKPAKARKAADRFLAKHGSSALAGQVRASCAFDSAD